MKKEITILQITLVLLVMFAGMALMETRVIEHQQQGFIAIQKTQVQLASMIETLAEQQENSKNQQNVMAAKPDYPENMGKGEKLAEDVFESLSKWQSGNGTDTDVCNVVASSVKAIKGDRQLKDLYSEYYVELLTKIHKSCTSPQPTTSRIEKHKPMDSISKYFNDGLKAMGVSQVSEITHGFCLNVASNKKCDTDFKKLFHAE